mgnify:CR=1 FL=1
MNDGPLTEFELYYTKKGLVQVSNDVRRAILTELKDKDLTLTELARILGKAQSTLSVHLDKMLADDLIACHEDPADSRRKIFSLVAVRFAYSKPPSEESMGMILGSISGLVDDPVQVRDAMIRFMFLGLDSLGLCVEPMSTILGALHGMALNGSLSADTFEDTVANARDYYSKMGIGEVSIYSLTPLTVIFKDNMTLTEDSAKALGGYVAGFMMKILEDATDKSYRMVHSEVYGTGYNYFKFTLEPVNSSVTVSDPKDKLAP